MATQEPKGKPKRSPAVRKRAAAKSVRTPNPGKRAKPTRAAKAVKPRAAEPEQAGIIIPVRRVPSDNVATAAGGEILQPQTDTAAKPVRKAARASKRQKQRRQKAYRRKAAKLKTKTSAEVRAKTPERKPVFRLPRTVRNTLISAGVLLVLLLAAGVLYTFFMGGGTPEIASTSAADVSQEARPIRPHKLAPNVPESAVVEMLTSPVSPGSTASIDVKTNPDSTCTITAVYNKVPSTDPGLSKKTADDFGTVSWTWTVGPNVPLGTWPVTVTCAYKLHSAVVEGDLQVAMP